MSKIRTRICDVCGDEVYQLAHYTYTIKKNLWELDDIVQFPQRIDLCEKCYYKMEIWILENLNKGE